jgi:hypothetical protein
MKSEMRGVNLPANLCDTAEHKFRQRFANIDELLVFVLRELVRDDAARLDEAERRMVEERLRDLGYV